MGSTLTTFDALLKERYIDSDRVEELTYPENVLLGMLEKRGDTGMVGDVLPVPIITVNPQGTAAVFATAQSNVSNIVASKFNITAGDYFGVVQIGDKVMMASRTNQGAFLEDKVTEIDGLYETAGENLSIYCWGNGGGSLGQVQSIATPTANDIVLVNPIDAQNFEIGMTCRVSANDGSDAAHTLRTGSTTVSAVNRATGVISFTDESQFSGFANGDFVFRSGDFFGTTGVVVMKGVQAFITATDVPQALWNLTAANRLVDPQRFAGCRVNPLTLGGLSYEERLKKLVAQMTGRFKSKAPTAVFMNPEDFQVLETLMGARGVRPLEDETTKFGYTKIDMLTGAGRIPIYSDRHCPFGTAFAFRMQNHWISSMGELLHVQNGDGLQMLRGASSTDYEFRLISYPLYANNCPKNHGRVLLQS
jgi:hypothetical protein